MSGVQWIRLDVGMARNHKILSLVEDYGPDRGRAAAFVYVAALTYIGEQGLDGFLPRQALPMILGKKADMERLVTVGLVTVDPGGWIVEGWSEFQATSAETTARRERARAGGAARASKLTPEQRSASARAAAEARWAVND